MKGDEPSRMALMVARQRAAHQLLDHGAILDDPYAVRILGEHEDNVLQAFNDHPLMSMGRLFTAARSRIAEDALSKAVERGVRQVVILGAGLDTFALRNPHAARISIFEVDHPATQAWKRQRLVGAELAPPPWLTFVPYVTKDAIDDTLGYIASIPNSEVVFDYTEPPETWTEDVKAYAAARM